MGEGIFEFIPRGEDEGVDGFCSLFQVTGIRACGVGIGFFFLFFLFYNVIVSKLYLGGKEWTSRG